MLKKHMNILRKAAIDYEYFQNSQLSRRNKVTGKIFRTDTKNYVIDGHRIFSTKESIDIDGCISVEDQYTIELCKWHIKETELCTFPVIINRQVLNEFCKVHRYEKVPYIIDLGFCCLGINPRYLRDQLDFIGTDTVFINPKDSTDRFNGFHCYIGLICTGNADRESIVLPINLACSSLVYGIQQDAAGEAA